MLMTPICPPIRWACACFQQFIVTDDVYIFVTAWLAWVATIVGTVLTLNNSMYGAFLQGSREIALYRRWESVTGLCGIVAAIVCDRG